MVELSEKNFEYCDMKQSSLNDTVPVLDSNQENIESTKSLRARFEALHNDCPADRPTPKSNRATVNNI